MTQRGKNIDLNHFKSYILSDVIGDSQIKFEDTRCGKIQMSKP